MLHFHALVGVRLKNGYSSRWSDLLAARGAQQLLEISDGSKGYNFIWMTEYLCSWSLELLKSSRSSLSLDNRVHVAGSPAQIQNRSPRAVCVGSVNDCLLYRTSSANTLAISHVLAHGQGGRSEDGINTCLH
jgi:hypothetical protein